MKKFYREPLSEDEKVAHKSNGEPAVYVGTYYKYNCGYLDGMWVDITSFDDEDEFIEFCKRLHADEYDPELMFQDHENFPRQYYSESHIDFDDIIDYNNLEDYKKEAFETYLDYINSNGTIGDFEDIYVGKYSSEEDFAEEYVSELHYESLNSLPDVFDGCINWSRVWSNLDFTFCDGYVFRY